MRFSELEEVGSDGYGTDGLFRAVGVDELEDVRWFDREQLIAADRKALFVPGSYSLAGQLIAHFLEKQADP